MTRCVWRIGGPRPTPRCGVDDLRPCQLLGISNISIRYPSRWWTVCNSYRKADLHPDRFERVGPRVLRLRAAKLASFKLTPDLLRARPFRLDAHALEELVSLSQELLGSFAWR